MRTLHRRAALLSGAASAIVAGQPAWASPKPGDTAPPLVVPELDGRTFDLAAQRGKVVIVNFWATWCAPCRKEMPTLEAFWRQHHGQGLELIGVSADRPRDRDDVVKVMRSFSYPAAMLKDAKANGFGAPEAIPITYVIDSAGTVRAKFKPDNNGVVQKDLDDSVLPLLGRN
jgi:cytochrome c biogenesis protein CcmG, thiol:disulfide interchange protein DsbE